MRACVRLRSITRCLCQFPFKLFANLNYPTMDPSLRRAVLRGLVDFFLTACVGLGVLLFYVKGQPYHRGFYCDDDSIRFPYKDSTVSNGALYIVGVLLPLFVMVCGEFARYRGSQAGGRPSSPGDTRQLRRLFACTYRYVGIFLFGAACSQFLTDVAKYTIGRLRPHFWDICKPDVDCSRMDPHTYIEDYKCQGENAFRIRESRLSFLSGHASFSAYTMLFAAAYLQFRWPFRRATPKIVRHFFQFVFILMAWYTSLSRVSDYKHHPTDVIAGALVGSTVATLMTFVVANRFREPRGARPGEEDEEGIGNHEDRSYGSTVRVEMNSPVRP